MSKVMEVEDLTEHTALAVGQPVWMWKDGVKDSGTILDVDRPYTDEYGNQGTNGYLCESTVEGTRDVYAPKDVAKMTLSSSGGSTPARRRRRLRSRVTPSPNVQQTNENTIEIDDEESDSDDEVEIIPNPKIDKKKPPAKKKAPAGASKPKKAAASKPKAASKNGKLICVEHSPSSTATCKFCTQRIVRPSLRIRVGKGPWLHAKCAKQAIGDGCPTDATTLDGYEDLEDHSKQVLQAYLQGATAAPPTARSTTVIDEPKKNPNEKPPAEKKKALKTAKKKKSDSEIALQESEEDDVAIMDLIQAEAPLVPTDLPLLFGDDTDSDDEKDRPFRVEYATTGRATCKTCDQRILKGAIRIGHRPLFRGKPGFVVYRHLYCAQFDDQVSQASDVGGWRRLKESDRILLEDRVQASALERAEEEAELHADELVQKSFEGEIRKPPPGLTLNLLPFQTEGVSWMYHQERHIPDIRGGILADEMGMGKTLQSIVTILDNRPKLQHSSPGAKHPPSAPDLDDRVREEKMWSDAEKSWAHEMEMANVPKKLIPKGKKAGAAVRAGTMVVCPVIALNQWKTEIEKFCDASALNVCIYHGPNRASQYPKDMLCKYDVVLTTYQVLEADFRKMVSPNKIKCPNCGGKFKIDKLRVHLKYFCGEGAQRTEAQARQRRTADRRGRNGNDQDDDDDDDSDSSDDDYGSAPTRRRKGSKAKSGPKAKIPSKPKRKSKKFAELRKEHTIAKKLVKVASSKYFDSDSDLSINDNVVISSKRPSRAAAKTANTKLKAGKKDWAMTTIDNDSDSFRGQSESSGDESSSDEMPPMTTGARKKGRSRKVSKAVDSSSESDSDKIPAKKRKLSRGGKAEKKSFPKKKATKDLKKKGKKKPPRKKNAVGKRKKSFTPDDDPSSSDDSSSDDSGDDLDPMAGIDLDKLMDEAMAGAQASVLHMMCWWRVILDEAHMIKSRSSQTAAAAFSLTSIHRWCLSGTPLQNRVGELYSLIRFLRIDPMAHYFCRKEGCGCKSIHYRMLHGKCQDCGHGSIQHFSYFNKHVLNPIQRDGYQGDGRRAMMKLKNDVLDKSLLRRTKQTRAEDMNLPPRVVQIRAIRLHPREEDFYNALYTQTKSSFDDYVTEGTLLNNYAHIFDLLTKMRQAVDHPYLIVHSKKNHAETVAKAAATGAPLVANGSVDCELCSEPPTDRVVASCCGAAFCRMCVMDYMSPALENANHDSTRCPSCREPLSIDLNQASADVEDDGTLEIAPSQSEGTGSATANMPSLREMQHVASGSILRRINLAEYATSTKVEALVEELVQMRQERPGSKALVFSQFVNMLDLVRWRLHSDPCLADLGIGVRIIHGGMNVTARDEALKAFREDNSVRVLLMSLKAGGVALNLTVANEAYLLDPWWNPAAEMQAIDRTHRLGQYRPIRAVRFIAEGTVEERVLQLQEKKRLVFDGTVGRDAASLKMLTVDDMKALFA